MRDLITLEGIRLEGTAKVNAEIGEGVRAAFVFGSEYEKNLCFAMLAGLKPSLEGRLKLLDKDVYALPERSAVRLYRHVGLVWKLGGLLSNLRVWENILLPAEFHRNIGTADVEQRVVGMLEEAGMPRERMEGFFQAQPSLLPAHEKSLAALARTMLMEPMIVIYDSIFDGLEPEDARRLTDIASRFDRAREGRVSVYLGMASSMAGHVQRALKFDIVVEFESGTVKRI